MRHIAGTMLCALLLAACADDNAAPTTTSTDTASTVVPSTASSGGAVAVDDSVVSRYIAALDSGDVATANSLRCDKGKVPDGVVAQFATEVESVMAAAGGALTLDQVSLVEPMTLGSLYGERPDSQIAFSLSTPAGPTSLVALAVITENQEPRVCGEMQEGSPGVQSQVSSAVITPSTATITDLSTALPTEIVPGASQVDDREVADLSQVPGAVAGWTRAWSIPGGGVRVTLFGTETPDTAVTLAGQFLQSPGLDSAEYLGGLPNGFQGVSAVASAWTWVHPASIGGRVDTAAGVAGDVVIDVEVTGVIAGEGHDTLTQAVGNLSFG